MNCSQILQQVQAHLKKDETEAWSAIKAKGSREHIKVYVISGILLHYKKANAHTASLRNIKDGG